jgi:hypothetical protein
MLLATYIKMKILLLFIFCVSTCANAQDLTIREIRLKPKPKFYKSTEATIIFPVVETSNKRVDKIINDRIKKIVLEEDDDRLSIRKALDGYINHGLVNMSYEVTFKKMKILSMTVYSEACGAYCSSSSTYFNFDLKTGRNLTIADLISDDKVDNFQKMVFADKMKYLEEYKKQMSDNLLKKEIDSTTYNWISEQVGSNCSIELPIQNFSLSDTSITISDPCQFPHVIKALEPRYQLKYAYNSISGFLIPAFFREVVK